MTHNLGSILSFEQPLFVLKFGPWVKYMKLGFVSCEYPLDAPLVTCVLSKEFMAKSQSSVAVVVTQLTWIHLCSTLLQGQILLKD